MVYNKKYNRWITKGGLVYRYNEKQDKLVLCKQSNCKGYLTVHTDLGSYYVHRLIYETFCGEIPKGYEIDHIDTNKENNELSNLKICTHRENMLNPMTRKRRTELQTGKAHPNKPRSEFGIKFKEHFGITRKHNRKLYDNEHYWYIKNGRCRWE